MKGLTDKTNHQSRVMGRIWILVITGLGLLTTVNSGKFRPPRNLGHYNYFAK